MSDVDHAMPVPDRRRRASFAERLARRSADAPLALCAGIDPSPAAIALTGSVDATAAFARPARVTTAGAIERFAGLVIESVRDHAVAVKPQLAWFESAGAPGMRALERTVAFARTAGLLVVLDGKRGDVPHTAAAYADAWLGDDAASGAGGDALTVNAAIGRDSLEAMAAVAAERHCALYALLHTSNPGAHILQSAPLADGKPWWHLLARDIARVDADAGGRIVGAVVGATHPELLGQARMLLPHAPLLLPGIGTQGAAAAELTPLLEFAAAAPTALAVAARSLLPDEPGDTQSFRFAVDRAAARLAGALRAMSAGGVVG